jgi:pimeloyl-ACP methyl ester carboxylesterase
MQITEYIEKRTSAGRIIDVRGLRYHVRTWPATGQPDGAPLPVLVMLHGWMDVSASFQFVVDAMTGGREVISLDWRGCGLTDHSGADCYWFLDLLGDLDAALDTLLPDQPFDLAGHSMGANVAMLFAGVRPGRVRRLVNLEGFGAPEIPADSAPTRYKGWLRELKEPASVRAFDSEDKVAERLRKTNPLLSPDKAAWLARHWARQRSDGSWEILGDPAHKRTNPMMHNPEEVLAIWRRITAPVLWVRGDQSPPPEFWGHGRCSVAEFARRLEHVQRVEKRLLPGAGHMLHHDQPGELGPLIDEFLGGST